MTAGDPSPELYVHPAQQATDPAIIATPIPGKACPVETETASPAIRTRARGMPTVDLRYWLIPLFWLIFVTQFPPYADAFLLDDYKQLVFI